MSSPISRGSPSEATRWASDSSTASSLSRGSVGGHVPHLLEAGRVQGHAVLARALGRVQGQVGGLDEGGGVAGILRRGGHAARDRERADTPEGGALDRPPDALGQLVRARPVGVREDQAELLAPDAAGVVVPAQLVDEQAAEAPQRLVALEVAVAVVDALEVVEVEQDDGHGVPVAVPAVELGPQLLVEEAVVGQAGDRVRARPRFEGVVGPRALDGQRGLVGEDLGQAELVLREHHGALAVDGEDAAQLAAGDQGDDDQRLGLDRRARHLVQARVVVVDVRRLPVLGHPAHQAAAVGDGLAHEAHPPTGRARAPGTAGAARGPPCRWSRRRSSGAWRGRRRRASAPPRATRARGGDATSRRAAGTTPADARRPERPAGRPATGVAAAMPRAHARGPQPRQ